MDGLRALAIISVMAVHAGVPGFALGWLGVDLFFVLSGFLITSLLAREFHRRGTVHLGRFWARRFLRLMPAYWIYAGFITWALAVGKWGWVSNHGGWSPRLYIASIWGYFVNYCPMGGIWEHQSLSVHLWSLAVEEQFYLLWPVVCVLLLRRGMGAATWIIAAVVLVRHGMANGGDIRSHLDTRGLGIIVGCAFALGVHRRPAVVAWCGRPRLRAMAIACVILIIGSSSLLHGSGRASELQLHRYAVPVADVAFAALVTMLWLGPSDRIGRALSWAPLAYLGRISYGMYIYHMAAHMLTWNILLRDVEHLNRWLKFGLRIGLYGTITVVAASISFFLIERPLLGLKKRLR